MEELKGIVKSAQVFFKRNKILNIKEFEGVIKYDEISMYHHAKLREKSHVEFQTVFNLKNGKCKQVKKMDWEFQTVFNLKNGKYKQVKKMD